MVAPTDSEQDAPIEPRTVKALALQKLKRTFDMFVGNVDQRIPIDEDSQKLKIAVKVRSEYSVAQQRAEQQAAKGRSAAQRPEPSEGEAAPAAGPSSSDDVAPPVGKSATARLIESMAAAPAADNNRRPQGNQLVVHRPGGAGVGAVVASDGVRRPLAVSSRDRASRLASEWPRPEWHAPWKNYRVLASHMGWVRSVAFDKSNEWFATGSADRTIKVWDLASGQLKLTLTGHIEQVTGLAVSDRHPYMFSCSLDKDVKCWDLEYNKVVRNYHGHLSGVFCLALHPTLDLLMSGGRDSVCRVWDMRTKVQVHCLSGHEDSVSSILTNPTDPQVITGSHDKTVRLWDIVAARTLSTLTYHKKSVRAMAGHPSENAFAAASCDNIKKYKLPAGEFVHNTLQNQSTIINSMAINQDGVMATGGDNGSLWFWDWRSGNNFQKGQTKVQPGSLESEAGIYAMAFDQTGSRLVTCEADKSVKLWKEDENATPQTHPINFRPPTNFHRF